MMINRKKIKSMVLSVLLILCVLSMFLPWFGGLRGVSEVKGTIVLNNPLTIICIVLAVLGIWISNRKMGRKLGALGFMGICIMEVHYFFTWHIETISGCFDISTSLSMAFPEFYVGLGIAATLLIMGFIFFRMERD